MSSPQGRYMICDHVRTYRMEEASGISESIYTQLLTRMRDHATQDKLIVVCSNPSLGWIKNVFYDNIARENPKHPEHEDYNPNIKTYIWKSTQNPFLPSDFVDNISKGKPSWWRKRYIDGSFDAVEGKQYYALVKYDKIGGNLTA